jgi:hypothetical protein
MEATDGRLTDALKGRRVHFAGSAKPRVEPSRLRYAHTLLKRLAKLVLEQGGGLVLTLGNEPVHDQDTSLPLIFDWTLLEAVDEYEHWEKTGWPEAQGMPIVGVALPKLGERIVEDRRPLWNRIVKAKNIDLIQIRTGLPIGGILRERQVMYGDILVAIGGGPGVEHLAELYISRHKAVIPLDLPLGNKIPSAAERLSTQAMENPRRFFEYEPSHKAAVAYSTLSLRDSIPSADEFAWEFYDFVSHLRGPSAFFVRLLDGMSPDFPNVEGFFRNVVDPVLRGSGYRRFEMGTDTSTEPFLNVEVFKELHHSSLVIADLTGLRPNCFMELGYAFGQAKRVIVTAREGTRLPFDSAAIPCHFWSAELTDGVRRVAFCQYMNKNINRDPLVS